MSRFLWFTVYNMQLTKKHKIHTYKHKWIYT